MGKTDHRVEFLSTEEERWEPGLADPPTSRAWLSSWS